jgi:hypothetical protein
MANTVPPGPATQVPGTEGWQRASDPVAGAFVHNPADPENTTRGRSVGQFKQDGIDITALCRAAFGH